MILNTSIFKKLMKEAYTGSGLNISHKNGMLHIWGSYWCVRVMDKFFTKKEKAALIELAGDIPEEGTIRVHRKEELEPQDHNIFEEYMRMEPAIGYQPTGITVMEGTYGTESRLLVSVAGDIVPVSRRLVDLIDETAMTEDDLEIDGPYQVEGGSWLMQWQNNTTAVAVGVRKWTDDETLTELKEGLEQLVDVMKELYILF